mmetsp:Transcript_26017/g.39383  ORF Transcript_26017/g.39383 Transcript_26017/m.39383 type:complete len:350 (+) Transcript_26017:105-1154(+)
MTSNSLLEIAMASSCSSSPSWPIMKLPPRAKIEYDFPSKIKSVNTIMSFVTPDTKSPCTRRDASGSDGKLEGLKWDEREVMVRNGRNEPLTLDENGFQLVKDEDINEKIHFYDQKSVVDLYYPHCEKLLKSFLGNVIVYAFDHNVRTNSKDQKLENNANDASIQTPIGVVHADYTHISAPKRLQQLAEPPKINDIHRQFLKEGETLLEPAHVQEVMDGKRRFVMVNVWRNISRERPICERPLACMDASSTSMDSLRTFSIYYPDRVGENYFCTHEKDQKWFYFPEMVHTEAILLKQWDSHGNNLDSQQNGQRLSTFAVHSSFMDPTTENDSPLRESIEVRCVVLYPQED